MKNKCPNLDQIRETNRKQIRAKQTKGKMKNFSHNQVSKLLCWSGIWDNMYLQFTNRIAKLFSRGHTSLQLNQLASTVEQLSFLLCTVTLPPNMDLSITECLAQILEKCQGCTQIISSIYQIFQSITFNLEIHPIVIQNIQVSHLQLSEKTTATIINTIYNLMVSDDSSGGFMVTEYLLTVGFSNVLCEIIKREIQHQTRETLVHFLLRYLWDIYVVDHSLVLTQYNQSLCIHLEREVNTLGIDLDDGEGLLKLFSAYGIPFDPFIYCDLQCLAITPNLIKLYSSLTFNSNYSLSRKIIQSLLMYAVEVPSQNGLIFKTLTNNIINDQDSTQFIAECLVCDRSENNGVVKVIPFQRLSGSAVRQFALLVSKMIPEQSNLQLLEPCLVWAESNNPLFMSELEQAGVQLVSNLLDDLHT